MNLIGNTCLSSFIMRDCLQRPYNNPFCWNVIDIESFCYLIEHYDTIDFNNFEILKDSLWNFSILIDGNVRVQFVHYKFSIHDNVLRRSGLDIFYRKIWEYIVDKYMLRSERMLELKEDPIFIIGSSWGKEWGSIDLDDVKRISKIKTRYKVILTGTMDVDFRLPDNMVYFKHALNKNNKLLSRLLFTQVVSALLD